MAELRDDAVRPLLSEAKLVNLVRASFERKGPGDPAGSTLATVRIDRQGEPFYLIADGHYPDGNDKKTAFPLTLMRQGERTLLILKKSAL